MGNSNDYDIAFVTALKKELNPILEICGAREAKPLSHEKFLYYDIDFPINGKKYYRAVACSLGEYGPKAAHMGTNRLKAFNPKICFMTGICAGWDNDKIEFGDVIVADKAYEPYDAAKMTKGGELRNDFTTYSPPKWLVQYIKNFDNISSWNRSISTQRPISLKNQAIMFLKILAKNETEDVSYTVNDRDLFGEIPNKNKVAKMLVNNGFIKNNGTISNKGQQFLKKDVYTILNQEFDFKHIRSHSELFINTYATVPYVVQEDLFFKKQADRFRKIRALDMEVAAFYEACDDMGIPGVAAKGVVDYADNSKDDIFHAYASEASIRYIQGFLNFLEEVFERELKIKPRTISSVEIHNGINTHTFCFDDESCKNLSETLQSNKRLIGFLSTSPIDPYQRYHLGHYYFVKFIDDLLSQSRNISLLVCDTSNQIGKEYDNDAKKRISEQGIIWRRCFDSAIDVLNVGDFIRGISIEDRRYYEILTWLNGIVEKFKKHIGTNDFDNLKRWRYQNLVVPNISHEKIHDIFEIGNDRFDQNDIFSMAYLLISRPRWFNEVWFLQFLKAIVEKKLDDFLNEKNGITIVESHKNCVPWDSMAFCAKKFHIGEFPKRIYIKNLPGLDLKNAMRSTVPKRTLFLSEVVNNSSYPDEFKNLVAKYFTIKDQNFDGLIQEAIKRLSQNIAP